MYTLYKVKESGSEVGHVAQNGTSYYSFWWPGSKKFKEDGLVWENIHLPNLKDWASEFKYEITFIDRFKSTHNIDQWLHEHFFHEFL